MRVAAVPAAVCRKRTAATTVKGARGTGERRRTAMARARMPLMWAFEVGRSTTAVTLVQDGMGAALLPQSAIGDAQVATCTLDALNIARPVGLLSRLGQRDSSPTIALKAAIRVAALANRL